MSFTINYEALPELARALKETDAALLGELRTELKKVGEIVREDAASRFVRREGSSAAVAKTAGGFETRVRAGGGAHAVVVVAQRLTKTTGRRPDYGARQMTEALLPARAANMEKAERALEQGAYALLRRHGFG